MNDYEDDYYEENFNYNNVHNKNIDTNEEEERIKVNFDELNEFKNYDVFELKLGNLSFLKRKRFSVNIDEKDEKIKLKMEKGEVEKPIPPINFIRWKGQKILNQNNNHNSNNKNIINDDYEFSNNTNKTSHLEKTNNDKNNIEANDYELDDYLNLVKTAQNYKMQTNSKIVEWSDGTMQMIIGSNYFDINPSAMDNCRFAIYDKANDLYVVKNPVKKRFILMASELTKNIDDRYKGSNENSTKTKLAYSFYDKNEYNKEDFAKKRFSKKVPNPIEKLRKNNDDNKNNNLSKLIRKKNY